MGKVEKQIIALLGEAENPLSLNEISSQIDKPSKTVFKALRKLFQKGEIHCDAKTRRYEVVRNKT